MNINHAETIVNKLKEGGVENIVFTGGGEPLFNAKTTLFGMKYAKDNGINVGLYTNGFLLDKQIIEEIMLINPLFIRISIYGMDQNSFERYTGTDKNCFYTVIHNVKQLLSAKNNALFNSKIMLSFLIHPQLYPDISYIDHFFDDYFSVSELKALSYIRFTPAVDYSDQKQHKKPFFDAFFEKVIENAERLKNTVPLVFYTHRLDDLYAKDALSQCLGSGFYTEVAPNGDIYLCCERLMDDDYLIGNIIDSSIEEIFSSARRAKLLDKINTDNCHMCPPLCKPHEINKQLAQISKISPQQLHQWKTDLFSISMESGIFSGNMNDFES